MRFLVDMPLSPGLAGWLRQQGHDAVHALEVGLSRASDAAILKHAQSEQRALVTADLDYPRLLALTQAEGPGLILFRGGNYSEQEAKDRLKRAFKTIPTAELPASIVVIEKGRIRRRRLPVGPGP
jgi:predicted nuclease of predicted toxin-antitoxin system